MTYNFDEIIDHCIFGSSCDPALKKCLPEISGRKRELTRKMRVSSLHIKSYKARQPDIVSAAIKVYNKTNNSPRYAACILRGGSQHEIPDCRRIY